ncbi:MAG: hypothetical protein AAF689_12225 [Pseudomonadota bacterium]
MSDAADTDLDLDDFYGPLKDARSQTQDEPDMEWEKERRPDSLRELDEDCGAMMRAFVEACQHKPFEAVATSFTLIWAMDRFARIFVAVEELAQVEDQQVDGGFPMRRNFPVQIAGERKLGHPCLVDGLQARAAGELYIDTYHGRKRWFVNFQSGRFHREVDRRPSAQQARNIAKLLAKSINMPIYLDKGGQVA